jgi:RNA polymerase sigma factor (sigma-70 family)
VRHWGSIRETASAEAYVRRIMYRDQVSVWRRREVTELPTAAIPEPRRSMSPGDEVEDRMLLRSALMRLGRRQRTVLVLRYFEDMTEQQVADVLGVRVGTVKSTSHKALQHLRETCGDLVPVDGGEPR